MTNLKSNNSHIIARKKIVAIITTVIIATVLTGLILVSSEPSNNAPSLQQYRNDAVNNEAKTLQISSHYQVISQQLFDNLVQKAYATGTIKHITLVASEGVTKLPTGDSISVFTFNGTYPAPTIRVKQGDTVVVTLINPSDNEEVHSIDFHGSQLSAVPNFGAVPPGSSKTLTFIAVNPGIWAYHCEANNVFELWEHPMKGMAGMLIVDPEHGYTDFNTNNPIDGSKEHVKQIAREFQIVYGEWYLDPEAEASPQSTTPSILPSIPSHDFDQAKMFNEIPTYAHVNGIPFGYIAPLLTLDPWSSKTLGDVMLTENLLPDNPNPSLSALTTPDSKGHTAATHLQAVAGEHVRFFIQNVGDKQVPFHIVGEQLDRVSMGSSIMAEKVQTWNIAPYSDATIDVVFEQPGIYVPVNHDYSLLFKGQAIIVEVLPKGSTPTNPSNTLPPPSALPDTSITTGFSCLYGIGPDKIISSDDDQFVSQCGV